MAEIVAAMASTHTPGLLGWFEDGPEDEKEMAIAAFGAMRNALLAARPDVMIIVANDHLLNWPINNMPTYTVGIAEQHAGPADWYQPWLARNEKYHVAGHSDLAKFMVNKAIEHRLNFAYIREDMQFDDGISTPLCYLNPDMKIPLIPFTMNCTVPPVPTQTDAYELGKTLRAILHEYPGDERVALIGSGGLSHEPGGRRYFFIDADFDRWFLDLLGQGDIDTLLRECTLERMEAAGVGGTSELLAWFVVLASTVGPAEVLGYCPSYAWRSGAGWVIWHDLLDQRD